jgi:hypothetical protein
MNGFLSDMDLEIRQNRSRLSAYGNNWQDRNARKWR